MIFKMKKFIAIFLVTISFSCKNEKLNEASIIKIYNNCVKKGNYNNIILEKIVLGKSRILNSKINSSYTLENYKKLQNLGLITFESNNTKYLGYEQYNISITEKGKPFLVVKNKKNYVKAYDLKIKEVKDIIIKKELPFAQAKIVLEKSNPTPFSFLSNKNDKTILINLNKENENWLLCK